MADGLKVIINKTQNTYTLQKTVGGKTATITIFDHEGDNRIENHDGFKATNASLFTTSEIQNFLREQHYIDGVLPNTTLINGEEVQLPSVESKEDATHKKTVKIQDGKEYNLGSLAKVFGVNKTTSINPWGSSIMQMPEMQGMQQFGFLSGSGYNGETFAYPTVNAAALETFKSSWTALFAGLMSNGTMGGINTGIYAIPSATMSMMNAAMKLLKISNITPQKNMPTINNVTKIKSIKVKSKTNPSTVIIKEAESKKNTTTSKQITTTTANVSVKNKKSKINPSLKSYGYKNTEPNKVKLYKVEKMPSISDAHNDETVTETGLGQVNKEYTDKNGNKVMEIYDANGTFFQQQKISRPKTIIINGKIVEGERTITIMNKDGVVTESSEY